MRTLRYAAGTVAIALISVTLPSVSAAQAPDPSALEVYYGTDLTPYQWWMDAVGGFQAHEAGYLGEGVVVAVLDTGVDGTHPDLAEQTVPGADTTGEVTVELAAGSNSDVDGHGTHVAGIIAARQDGKGTTGVAAGAKIMPVRVLTSTGGTVEGIARGIDWAVANGADVINMSLGGAVDNVTLDDSSVLCAAVANAAAAGVAVVVSAGNDGTRGNPLSEPAGCPGALSVSALDSAGQPTWFTSFDPSVRISAPGRNILSTIPETLHAPGYAPMNGTSMAGPIVAGAAALLLGKAPNLTPQAVYDTLTSNATDMGKPGRDPVYGYGMLTITHALGVDSTPTWHPVPHIIGIGASAIHGNNIVVSWSTPGNLDVTSYRVERFPSRDVLAEVDGNQVRVDMPTPIASSFSIAVTATLANGQEVRGEPQYITTPAALLERFLRGTWTKKGLKVEVFSLTGPLKAEKDLEVVVFDAVYVDGFSPYFQKVVTVKEGTAEVFIPVAEDNPARGRELSVAFVEDLNDGGLVQFLPADWPVSIRVLRVNKAQVTIGGAMTACPPWGRGSEHLPKCLGRSIAVVDPKGRTLQRGVLAKDAYMEPSSNWSYGYSLTVTKPPKKIRVIFGSWKSPLIRVPSR